MAGLKKSATKSATKSAKSRKSSSLRSRPASRANSASTPFGHLWGVNTRLARLSHGERAGTVALSRGTRTDTKLALQVKQVRALKRRYASLTRSERVQPVDVRSFLYVAMTDVARSELQDPAWKHISVALKSDRVWRMKWEEEMAQQLTMKLLRETKLTAQASPEAILRAVLRLANNYEQQVAKHSTSTGRNPSQRWGAGKAVRRARYQTVDQASKQRARQRRLNRRAARRRPQGGGGLWELFA